MGAFRRCTSQHRRYALLSFIVMLVAANEEGEGLAALLADELFGPLPPGPAEQTDPRVFCLNRAYPRPPPPPAAPSRSAPAGPPPPRCTAAPRTPPAACSSAEGSPLDAMAPGSESQGPYQVDCARAVPQDAQARQQAVCTAVDARLRGHLRRVYSHLCLI
jgi:hypothetical protein